MAPAAIVAGSVLGSVGGLESGRAGKKAAKAEMAFLRLKRNVVAVATQRDVSAMRKQGELAVSHGIAGMGISGTSVDSPSVLNALAKAEAQSESMALDRMWSGEMEKRGINQSIRSAKRQGEASMFAGFMQAAGSVVSGVSAWNAHYGLGLGGGSPGSTRYDGGR